MEIESVAQLMQVLLYQKRFFPYYTFNTLGGIDAEGIPSNSTIFLMR